MTGLLTEGLEKVSYQRQQLDVLLQQLQHFIALANPRVCQASPVDNA